MHCWIGQSFSKMKTPGNIVKKEYFYICVRHVTFFLSVIHGWVWPSFGCVWPFIYGCGWVWMSVTLFWPGECDLLQPFFGWLLVGVGECDLFLAGCWWVWVGVNFFWLGVGGYELFLAWCGRVWVSARFITAHF